MKRLLCGLLALGLLQGVTGQVMAQPTYSFTTVDVPGASHSSTGAHGINASGQIVGCYEDAAYKVHGFLLDQGSYTTLDAPGPTGLTSPQGINDSGQVVGFYYDAGGAHGFLLDKGVYTTLNVPRSRNTFATGINASGQIVGYYGDTADAGTRRTASYSIMGATRRLTRPARPGPSATG
jgi:probable HAF family extracellular repeat protein